jgi:hypothetical protein
MCAEGTIEPPYHEEVEEVSVFRLAVGGALAMFVSCLIVGICLPFLLVLIVPVGLFLMAFMAWSLAFGELSSRKAQQLAKKHLSASRSELQVIEQVGDGSCLVLNDWGVVFCSVGKRPVELSWNEIAQVEEPESKVLMVYGHNEEAFKLDLAVVKRFFLITSAMMVKIPRICNFDINPLTAESRLLDKLKSQPRQWQGLWGRFEINANGIQRNDKLIHYDLLQSIVETIVDADPDPGILGTIRTLNFQSVNDSFAISNAQLGDSYELVKRILWEKLPDRASFAINAKTPSDIAYEEFCLLQENLPLSKHVTKTAHLERCYKYMLFLVKRFKFKFYPQVRRFLDDYAELLRRMKRDVEAKELEEFVPD